MSYDDHLSQRNDVGVPLRLGLNARSQERTRQTLAAGDAGDGTAETMNSSQGGAVGTLSARGMRAETLDILWVRFKGGTWTPLRPQKGRSKATQAQHQPAVPTKGMVRFPPRSSRGGKHPGSATGNGSRRQKGAGSGVKANAWKVNLPQHRPRMRPEVADVLLAAAYDWTKSAGVS